MGRKSKRYNKGTRRNGFAVSAAEQEAISMAKSTNSNPSIDHELNRLMTFINECPKGNDLFGLMAISKDRLQFYFCDGLGMDPNSKEFDDITKVVAVFGPFMEDKSMNSSSVVGKFLNEVYQELSQGDTGIDADVISRYVRYLADEPIDNADRTQARLAFCKAVNRALPFITKKLQVINGVPVLLGQEDPTSNGVAAAEDFDRDSYSEDLRYALAAYLIVERAYILARPLYTEWIEAPVITADQDETSTATHGSSGNSDPEVVDPPVDDPEGSVSGDDNSDEMSSRFPELAGLIATATSMDKLFVQIAESEGAMREINSIVDPVVKQYAEKLPPIDYRILFDWFDCTLTYDEMSSMIDVLTERPFIDVAIDTLIPKLVESFQLIGLEPSKTNLSIPSREACAQFIGKIDGVQQVLKKIDDIVATLSIKRRSVWNAAVRDRCVKSALGYL